MKLRDYQERAMQHYVSKPGNSLFVIATGKGKSILSLSIILKHLEESTGNILILCPTQIIRQQLYNLYKTKIEEVIILEGSNEVKNISNSYSTRVFICCYPTYEILSRKEPCFVMSISMLIIDEVHKINRGTSVGQVIKKVSQLTNMTLIGLTATPGSRKNLKEILDVLSCREKDMYIDNIPLHPKEEEVVPIETSKWRLELIDSLKGDITSRFCSRFNLSPKLADFPFVLPGIGTQPYITATYLLLNKLTRFVHGATPKRILSFYQNNIESSKLRISTYFSSSTISKINNILNEVDQRITYLKNTRSLKRIIFVDDILIGEELKELLPDSFFINSKEKKEIKGIFKKLKEKKDFNLIATSIAQEGLNLNLDEVINFEVPTTKIKLEQRKGRVGRYRKGYVTYFNLKNTYGSSLLLRYGIKNSNKKKDNSIKEDEADNERIT